MRDKTKFLQENSVIRSLSRRGALRFLLSCLVVDALLSSNHEQKSIVCTGFIPSQHGFHFPNSFVNSVLVLPQIRVVTYGRCGGMAYTALDYYFFGSKIPPYTYLPEQLSPDINEKTTFSPGAYQLSHHLFVRQVDTMLALEPFGRTMDFVWCTLASNQCLFQWSVRSELKKVCYFVDNNIPIPLGLIAVSNLIRIGENHHVVLCGYEMNIEAQRVSSLLIYDPNHPEQTVVLTIDYNSSCFRSSTGKIWRGFFVRDDYVPQLPTWLDN